MAFKSQSPWKINVVGLLWIVCWNIISFVSLPVSVIPPRSLLNGVIYFCVIANIQISAARKKKLRQSFCSFLIQAGCFSSAFCCDTDKNDGSEKELTEVFWVTGQGLDSFPDLLHFFFFFDTTSYSELTNQNSLGSAPGLDLSLLCSCASVSWAFLSDISLSVSCELPSNPPVIWIQTPSSHQGRDERASHRSPGPSVRGGRKRRRRNVSAIPVKPDLSEED